jgi:phosphatidate cytidylyltransferase
VSPGKTWEGLAGGVLLGTAAATVASYFMFDGAWYIGTVVGVLATLAAAVGDLAESAIKRDMNIKDMSGAIPGHGGVLDRLDSMVFAAPVAYVAFAVFLGTL